MDRDNEVSFKLVDLNNQQDKNLYDQYRDFIRTKYGDAFADSDYYVTPWEDTYIGWLEEQTKSKELSNGSKIEITGTTLDIRETNQKLLGE